MEKPSNDYHFAPIGVVHSTGQYRFETPRQGAFARNTGTVELFLSSDWQCALDDLAGFEYIWLIFVFDRNLDKTVHPKTLPPVGSAVKRGVFATRSPYRPNPIGLSAVKLLQVEHNFLHIADFDLLDQTPILDIKPYIPEADAYPDAACGWRGEMTQKSDFYKIDFAPEFLRQNTLLTALGGVDLAAFCQVQLAVNPLDKGRKRLYQIAENTWEIGCRTWRIGFEIDAAKQWLRVLYLRSNYTASDLLEPVDKYGDKPLHRQYLAQLDRQN